ncbi:conserved hypothetical protein [Chlorobium limicola DSM 245]|uniref:Uncharacterized protein n=1 Tax=Chlorobium limicola (strain DSM 245 / NBRC 103803 / 6330) TaxID=290315 RepID=B3ED09_CHLL2|nr:hypothetical protein [Chlorobium limicola]ACD90434.1 conserved hypothetical protein [Chlorobium limicola DSM 245]
MLKDAAAAAGGAILLTPLGMPFVMHGVAGMLIGGAGLFIADSLMKQVVEVMNNQSGTPETPDEGSGLVHLDVTGPDGGQ